MEKILGVFSALYLAIYNVITGIHFNVVLFEYIQFRGLYNVVFFFNGSNGECDLLVPFPFP